MRNKIVWISILVAMAFGVICEGISVLTRHEVDAIILLRKPAGVSPGETPSRMNCSRLLLSSASS